MMISPWSLIWVFNTCTSGKSSGIEIIADLGSGLLVFIKKSRFIGVIFEVLLCYFFGACLILPHLIYSAIPLHLVVCTENPKEPSRYLNVDSYVDWGQQVLRYQAQGDFSQISLVFTLDEQAITSLGDCLDEQALAQLSGMKGKEYPDEKTFISTLIQHLGPELFAPKGKAICQAADVGRRKFQEKFTS